MPSPIGHALAGIAIAWLAEKHHGPAERESTWVEQSLGPERAAAPRWSVTPAERSVIPERSAGPERSVTPERSTPTAPKLGAARRHANRPAIGKMAIVCALLAVLPDIDLVYLPIHRTVTHSVPAAILVTIVAAAVTGRVTGRVDWRMAITCGVSYGSHIVLDWLGADTSPPFGIQALWPFSERWFVSPFGLFPGTQRFNIFSARSIQINLRALLTELVIFVPVVGALWITRTRRIRGRTSVRGDRPPPSV